MTNKITMPEPVAHCKPDDPDSRTAFSWPGSLANPDHQESLYTTDQAESYKDACVREALEQVIKSLEAESAIARGHKAYSAVLALMSQAELIRLSIEKQ